MTIMDAATALAKSLGPAAFHSVYVNTDVGDDKNFIHSIHVAVRPAYKAKIKVPEEFQGFAVKQVPWPKEG